MFLISIDYDVNFANDFSARRTAIITQFGSLTRIFLIHILLFLFCMFEYDLEYEFIMKPRPSIYVCLFLFDFREKLILI